MNKLSQSSGKGGGDQGFKEYTHLEPDHGLLHALPDGD